MAEIPEKVKRSELSCEVEDLGGLHLSSQGKVKDIFDTGYLTNFRRYLLMLHTDRVSIFNFILPALVRGKGEILAAMTVCMFTQVLKKFDNHLTACGSGVDKYLCEELKDYPDLQSRALVVKEYNVIPIEFIVRGYLTGSAWLKYQEGGLVFGHKLPKGLHDGSKLDKPIFTPTEKSETDEPLDLESVRNGYPGLEEKSIDVYKTVAAFTEEKGIITADMKLEISPDGVLLDEISPDTCRFWIAREWEKAAANRKAPENYDKEYIRQWGKTVETPFGVTGLHGLDPENFDHLDFVSNLEVPEEVLEETSKRYTEVAKCLFS